MASHFAGLISAIGRQEDDTTEAAFGCLEAAARRLRPPCHALTVRRLDPATLHQHIDPMYRAALALSGSREDAEDLVQETFVNVLSWPRAIRGEERGYLTAVAAQHLLLAPPHGVASGPRTTPLPEHAEPPDPRAPAPDRAAEIGKVLAAVAELPEDFRLTIAAVDMLGLSYAEAAQALHVPEATITTRLCSGAQRIAEAVSPIHRASRR